MMGRGTIAPPNFDISVNPTSIGGWADYAHQITICPLRFLQLPTALPRCKIVPESVKVQKSLQLTYLSYIILQSRAIVYIPSLYYLITNRLLDQKDRCGRYFLLLHVWGLHRFLARPTISVFQAVAI